MEGNQFASSGGGKPHYHQILSAAKASQDSELFRASHLPGGATPVKQLLHCGTSLFYTNTEILFASFSNFSIVPCCPVSIIHSQRKTKTASVQPFPFSLLHMTLIDSEKHATLQSDYKQHMRQQVLHFYRAVGFAVCFLFDFWRWFLLLFFFCRECAP